MMGDKSDWRKAYLFSGWLFLLPYFAIYLVYALLGWPVHGPFGLATLFAGLHATHFVLALFVLWPLRHRVREQPETLLPWLGLALLLLLPGLYLEWPSDPWEHLRRINEWRALEHVTDHSVWRKWPYFLHYSLTSWTTGELQLHVLNALSTGVALLLCWQYYRLGLVVGISAQASLIFVILQVVLLGNSGFSFYRYYALSSSVIAQLGAVVLIRMAVERAQGGGFLGIAPVRPGRSATAAGFGLLGCLVAFSHPQALGLALLVMAAAVAATFPRWPRAARLGTGAALVAANAATFIILQRSSLPGLETLRQQGWLAPWYGFHLLDPWSAAGQRALSTLGLAGVANLIVAVAIARYRPIVAWLTLLPVAALSLPLVAAPLAAVLLKYNPDIGVLTFARLLFGIPLGLALATFVDWLRSRPPLPALRSPLLPTLGAVALLGLVVVPMPRALAPSSSWHFLAVPPDDLQLRPLRDAWSAAGKPTAAPPGTRVLAGNVAYDVLAAFRPSGPSGDFRNLGGSTPQALVRTLRTIESAPALPRPRALSEWPAGNAVVLADTPVAPELPLTDRNRPDPRHDFTRDEWVVLSGETPRRTSQPDGDITFQTPAGAPTRIVTSAAIDLDPSRRYALAIRVRQNPGSAGTNYLGVGWYDAQDQLLPANQLGVHGAGQPTGWVNGSMSYYGLLGTPAPEVWTTYRQQFGPGESGVIPPNARRIRIAALLNDNSAAGTVVELAGISVQLLPEPPRTLFVGQRPTALYSPGSQLGLLSGHWNPCKVAIDLTASPELLRAYGF